MSFIPVATADDIVSSSLFAGEKKTSDLGGLYESMRIKHVTDPIVDAYHYLNRSTMDNQGQFLTPKEIQAKYPAAYKKYSTSGGYEKQVAYDDSVISSKNLRTDLVKNMNPGFLAEASKFVGSAIGMVTSPTTIIVGALTGGAGSFAADSLSSTAKLAEVAEEGSLASKIYKIGASAAKAGTVANKAYKIGSAALETGTTMVPSTVGEDIFRKYSGDKNVHMLRDASYAFVQGAALGAVLKTAVGYIPTMDPFHGRAAIETATRQFDNGEKISVDKIIKQGHYEASKTWEHTPEEIQKAIDDLQPENDKLAAKQTKAEAKIKDHKATMEDDTLHDKAVEADSYKNFIKDNDLKKSDKMKSLYKTSSSLEKALDDIKEKKEDLSTTIDNTKLYKQMVINKPKPVDQGELLSEAKKVGSPENQQTFNKSDADKANEIMNSKDKIYQKENMNPEELGRFLDDRNNDLDDFVKNADLSDEAKDLVDEGNNIMKQHDELEKIKDKYYVCIGGE